MRLARAFGPNLRHLLRLERDQLSAIGARSWARWNGVLIDAWLRDRLWRHRYRNFSEDELRAARSSDTVFVFGSGYSLNDITTDEWAYIAAHDTFGFNAFYNQRWIDVGFYLIRGGIYGESRWRPYAESVGVDLRASPHLDDAVFLLQGEYLGQLANQLVGYGFLPPGRRLFRYRTSRMSRLPTRSFADGIQHDIGTLTDAVHCAYSIGWKHIVLVGVDLYDSRYFWLDPDKTLAHDQETALLVPAVVNNVRNIRYDETHNTAMNGVVQLMERWAKHFEQNNVRLSVWNPRSLLAQTLPIYERPSAPAEAELNAPPG
jgi:hypothetical protein